MGIEVTDVRFSIAKASNGSCGFCQVIINGCIAINRVTVVKTKKGYSVMLPRAEKYEGVSPKPVVQLLNDETIKVVTQAVLDKYHKLVKENNGFYLQKRKFKHKEYVN
jgi:DNA-binding cell septation regulator SpoVG